MTYKELKAYYASKKYKLGRDVRLKEEHLAIAELCERTTRISYEPIGKRLPPESYKITYRVKSIIGIDEDLKPQYGFKHTVEIGFPKRYPNEPLRCYMTTDTWHPNIQSSGPHKGYVCLNIKEFGPHISLDIIALRLGEMLQYKNYHALHIEPYPEDATVAKWVRDHGNNYFDKNEQKYVDNDPLIDGGEPVIVINPAANERKKSSPSFTIKPRKESPEDS